MYRPTLPVYSMGNTEYYGTPLKSSVSHKQAVDLGRITPARLIVVDLNDESISQLCEESDTLQIVSSHGEAINLDTDGQKVFAIATLACRLVFQQLIGNKTGRKAIAFTSRIADCQRLLDASHPLSIVRDDKYNIECYEYHSDLTSTERHRIKRQYAAHQGPALMAAVRAIREGVSINDVDTVFLLRGYGRDEDDGISTELVQHIGRAVRTVPDRILPDGTAWKKQYANVVVPLPPIGMADSIRRRVLSNIRDLMEQLGIMGELVAMVERGDKFTVGMLRSLGVEVAPTTELSEKCIVDAITTEVREYVREFNPDVYKTITDRELVDFIDNL